MAAQSLYRRYRPRTFTEVRGQEHVIRALRNAVSGRTEGHAYLFSGPRGTGKTSTARLLAKALNCTDSPDGEPCGRCESCVAVDEGRSLDIFELDAASNNGVDAMRDLIARASVGSPGKVKVYILDEVHMLSAGASNALLKTLEEPPDHVRFVLATTDPQKVLPTIKSRAQHFEFKLLTADELLDYVRWIREDAGLDADDDALAWAVREGRGSARDTLSALDRVVASGGVLERAEPTEALLEALAAGDAGAAVAAVSDAVATGRDPRVLAEALLAVLRDTFLVSLRVELPHVAAEDLTRFGEWAGRLGAPMLTRALEAVGGAIVEMRNAPEPRIPFELALVRLTIAPAAAPASASTAPASGRQPAAEVTIAALEARIERLERALADGGAPAPVTGASTERSPRRPAAAVADHDANPAAPRAGAGAGPAAARAALHATEEQRGGAARPAATRPARQGAPAPAAPAAAAPPPRAGSAGRPSIGAVRAQASGGSAPATASGDATPGAAAGGEPGNTRAAEGTARDASAGGAGAASGAVPTLDQLATALAEVVLPQLKPGARSIYADTHVASYDGDTMVLGISNSGAIGFADSKRGEVEAALGAYFGRAIKVRLQAGATAATPAEPSPGVGRPPGAAQPARSTPHPGSDAPLEEFERIDIDELEDAVDVADSSVDRLKAVFPGAVEVDPES